LENHAFNTSTESGAFVPALGLKDASTRVYLRKWFHHDPALWNEFRRRYFIELKENPASWLPLLKAARRGDVTLIYSSHNSEHNNAIALKEFLIQSLGTENDV
jgi:uncharacterized protein YeaO (DUF488 family)